MDDIKTLIRFRMQVHNLKENAGIADVLDLLDHQIDRARIKQTNNSKYMPKEFIDDK